MTTTLAPDWVTFNPDLTLDDKVVYAALGILEKRLEHHPTVRRLRIVGAICAINPTHLHITTPCACRRPLKDHP
jgi:hypothetical protein